MMETCSYSHSSPKRLLWDVGSLDVLIKDLMPEKGKDAMDLPSQRVLMKFILFHCLANTSDQTPLPLPLVIENDDTPLEERKLQYRFRPTWSTHQKRSNLGSSKPNSNSQLPNLNIKRKRFSQPTATVDPELKASLLQEEPESEASAARKIMPRLKIIPPKKPPHLGSSSASSIATADPEKDSPLQEEPEPSAAPKTVPRLKIIPPKKPPHLGSSSASPIATADPEKASLLQEEPELEASAAPKTVPRLKIIPPKKTPHLGCSSASPIAIPVDSASLLSEKKSPIHKPKRQRINPTSTSRFNHHIEEVEVG